MEATVCKNSEESKQKGKFTYLLELKKYFFLFFLITFSFTVPAKDKIQKGFDRLAIYDYFQARQYFMQCAEKQPIPSYYGLSIICSRSDNPFFNMDSARVYILTSDSLFNYLTEKKVVEMRKKYNLGSEEIFARKDSIALTAFQIAARANDIRSWNEFIEKYSFSRLHESAIATRNNLAYGNAKKENTSSAYKQFLDNYGNAGEAIEVRRHYEERLFHEQTQAGTEEAYASFISNHPKSPYQMQAEDSLFTVATINKSPEEYYSFAKKYPRNRNASTAWMKLYRRYLEINGLNSYEKFLSDYHDFPFRKRVVTDYALYNMVLLPVKQNEKWGFITEEGKPAIAAEYDEVDHFSEGLCAVSKYGKYGYINKGGKTEINFLYDEADAFENNLATVKIKGKTTLINREGEQLFEAKYDEAGSVHDDRILFLEKDKYGYIDAQGKLAIPAQFESAADFTNGIAVAGIEGKSGVIDRQGQWIILPDYNFISIEEGGLIKVKRDAKFGLYNRYGEQILPVDYDAVGKFSVGLAIVAKKEKSGYINNAGQLLIPMIYDFDKESFFRNQFIPDPSGGGFAAVKYKGKAGVIDTSGNKIIPFVYDDLRLGISSTMPVAAKKKGKWGYMNLEKKILIPFRYDDALEFAEGYATVKLHNHYGVINTSAKSIIPFQYDFISSIKNEVFIVKKNNLFGIISSDNTQLAPLIYDKYEWTDDYIVKFEQDEKISYYNSAKKIWIWQEKENKD